jgi:hypothetical protein
MNVSQPLPLLSGALLNNQEFSLARTVGITQQAFPATAWPCQRYADRIPRNGAGFGCRPRTVCHTNTSLPQRIHHPNYLLFSPVGWWHIGSTLSRNSTSRTPEYNLTEVQ